MLKRQFLYITSVCFVQLKHFYASQWRVNSMEFINEKLCIFVTKIPLWTSFHLPPRMRWFQLSRFHFKNKIFGVVRFTKVIYHLVVGFTESLHKNHFLHIQCGWKIDYFTFELQKSLTHTKHPLCTISWHVTIMRPQMSNPLYPILE